MRASEETPLLKKDAEPQSLDVLALVGQLGFTVLGLFCNGANMTLMNLVLTVLVVDSPATAGLLTSSFNVGQFCGQCIFGPLVDIAGPKAASLTSAAVGVLGAAFSASAGTVMSLETQLMVGRFVVGIGTGGEYPVVASLSKAIRTHFTHRQTLACSMASNFAGNASITSLYLILIPALLPPDVYWRTLLAAAGLPSLACFLLRLKIEVPAEAALQVPGDSQRGSAYRSLLWKSFVEKGGAYIATVLSWSCAHILIQVTGSYMHVYVEAAVGAANVQPRTLLLYNGLQSLFSSLMTMFGCFSAFHVLRYMQIEWAQGICLLVIASLLLVEAALGEEYSLLALVTIVVNQFPQGIVQVTTYTIVAEMFPKEVVGTFVGTAGIIIFTVSSPASVYFPIFVDAYGLRMAELAESALIFLGAMSTLSMLHMGKTASHKSDSESLSGIGSA
eukprot:TRINITY_DN77011_c0_g1_i1.p1 TRINITY_DN77011_c0_g1~~TRINITY_DN77011_c0_g1_i1.p1  ORF type:complete len:479 (-),score=68.24 TRINITY_DN77011_c0_g1_i1:79-1416(-)